MDLDTLKEIPNLVREYELSELEVDTMMIQLALRQRSQPGAFLVAEQVELPGTLTESEAV